MTFTRAEKGVVRAVRVGDRFVGDGQSVFVVAEVGINHNGCLDTALRLVDAAADAGCDAVKFQKRTPALCVPQHQRSVRRETPWGCLTYLEYRERVELWEREYAAIDRHCRQRGILWFASCWDEAAVDFVEAYDPPAFKAQSAAVADLPLLRRLRRTGRPVILSTGMSTMQEIRDARRVFGDGGLVLCHSTSAYPCVPEELNLRMIQTLQREFADPIGYSGHEVGLPTTVAAVALGARYVERHITLDRAMWGTDQSASVEPDGFKRLVHYIRVVERAMGDGVKRIYESELPIRAKLARTPPADLPIGLAREVPLPG